MEIKIPLPNKSSVNTIEELNHYLKQLELAVHYAQKSVRNAVDMGIEVTEDTFIDFTFPGLTEDEEESYYEQLQNIELRINIQ